MTNKDLPLVSIGIPTYNRAEGFLKQALQSAVNQTYQNIEIIISDNCSTDNTEMVVRSFNDPRIRYFKHKENIGANNNFNYCVEQARGAYFLLLHDDDLIDNDFVDVCMRAANYSTDVGLIHTGTRVIDSKGNARAENPNIASGKSVEDFIFDWFFGKTPLYLCSSLFNAQRLKEIGGFKSKKNLYQDVVAEVQLAAKYGRIDIPAVKASFRRHADNMGSSSKIRDWCEDSLYLLDTMCNLAPQNKSLIREKGMLYFSKRNYDRVFRSVPLLRRLSAYLIVYKKFNYRYSPVNYVYSRNIKRLKGFMKRKLDHVSP
jgi:glycosyltransferase involved in cell wall biosynthesis